MISILAAMSENRVIGRGGGLPWRLPEDLKRFKALTMGHHVVMGRRTYESVGKPLPGRVNIVITRDPTWGREGVLVARDFQRAIALVKPGETEVFVIGGGQIYARALPRADRLDLTIIHAHIEGDTYFPAFDEREWRQTIDERHEADARHAHAFSFRRYERA